MLQLIYASDYQPLATLLQIKKKDTADRAKKDAHLDQRKYNLGDMYEFNCSQNSGALNISGDDVRASYNIDDKIRNLNWHDQHIKTNLMELHQKECSMLRERTDFAEQEKEKLQFKLIEAESSAEELKIRLSETQGRLSNELTEARGLLKLKQFECDKYNLSYEETLSKCSQYSNENSGLKEKVDILKSEYYSLENRLKQENAQDR